MGDDHIHPATVGDMQPQGTIDPAHGPGHEPFEIKVRNILAFGIALAIVCLIVFFVISTVFMGNFVRDERRAQLAVPERLRDDRGQFPEPRLQASPPGDLTTMRKEDAAALDSYGWVDQKKGIARIPIDRAIDILATEGLPTRRADAKAKPPRPQEDK